MTTMREVRELLQAAKLELLTSPLRKEWDVTCSEPGHSKTDEDQGFLYELWNANKDDDVWAASPSLGKALVAYTAYRAEDELETVDKILSNVNGRNRLELFDMADFDEACWDEWRERKPNKPCLQCKKAAPVKGVLLS